MVYFVAAVVFLLGVVAVVSLVPRIRAAAAARAAAAVAKQAAIKDEGSTSKREGDGFDVEAGQVAIEFESREESKAGEELV
jgi:hypothetical protein